MLGVLILDGAHGEGGGQILRTALALSAVSARPFRLINIRAGRRNPGLLPQHLSAVRAVATITAAQVAGDRLGSSEIEFKPSRPPQGGHYVFDVVEAAERGSAGSVTLILQTLVLPLAVAANPSELVLRGGTHVEWSPPFDDFVRAYCPALRAMGLRVEAELKRWGWYPVGGGEVVCRIGPSGRAWRPVEALARGSLARISGRAVAANLPSHIPQRMADRARAALSDLGVPLAIEAERVSAACPGAGIFLLAQYEPLAASFSAYGRLGKPSEAVADEAVGLLREHHAAGAGVEIHLADQLLVPLALARGPSAFTVGRLSGHLTTNAWVIEQFGMARIALEAGAPCRVRVDPRGAAGN
ncbi:MAG TPA: RNA 3'-terminal phosphate cyclase [Xanthobacteraceae bacterium]